MWSSNEAARATFGYAVELDELHVPVEVKNLAFDLLQRFDRSLDWNNPNAAPVWSREDRIRFDTDSQSLLQQLSAHLGPYSEDLDALLEHRVRLDAIISSLAAEVRDADLAQVLTYKNSRGECRKHFGSLLLHLFNHQTHHRGQASTLLSQAGIDIGVTDLLECIPEHC